MVQVPNIPFDLTEAAVWSRGEDPRITESYGQFWNTVITVRAEQASKSRQRPATDTDTNAGAANKKPRAARGPNKVTQAIFSCIAADTTGKGMTATMIAKETSFPQETITKRLASLTKSKKLSQAGSRFSIAQQASTPARVPETTTPTQAKPGGVRTRAASKKISGTGGISLSDATLQAVSTLRGPTANEVSDFLKKEFGMTVRPNHLGIALQRHKRGARIVDQDSRWYMPAASFSPVPQESAAD